MRRILPIGLLCALILSSGCAMLNRDNLRAFNLVENELVPEEPAAQIIATPALLAGGFTALCADQFVLHPLAVADDAAIDTWELLWDDLNLGKNYLLAAATVPWRLLVSPFVFIGDWFVRSIFDIRSNNEYKYVRKRRGEGKEKPGKLEDPR